MIAEPPLVGTDAWLRALERKPDRDPDGRLRRALGAHIAGELGREAFNREIDSIFADRLLAEPPHVRPFPSMAARIFADRQQELSQARRFGGKVGQVPDDQVADMKRAKRSYASWLHAVRDDVERYIELLRSFAEPWGAIEPADRERHRQLHAGLDALISAYGDQVERGDIPWLEADGRAGTSVLDDGQRVLRECPAPDAQVQESMFQREPGRPIAASGLF